MSSWQAKRMVDNIDASTVGGRISSVIEACRFPTFAAFADAVGEKPQNVRNWILRNSFGRAGTKIRAATGVSLDWLATGEGEPFPDGPKRYQPPKGMDPRTAALITNQLENDVDALRYLCAALVSTLAVTRPAEGAAVAEAIRAAAPEKFVKNGLLKRALKTLDAGARKARIRHA